MIRLLVAALLVTASSSHGLQPTWEELRASVPREFQNLSPEALEWLLTAIKSNRTADSAAIANGRLTLSTGVPVTTSDVTAATTIYFTPYNGNKITLYASSRWLLINFTETSIAVPATTATNYDVFGYYNAGSLALELVSWNSDTTRFSSGTYATTLPTQDGIYVKSTNGTAIDNTRRYLGSFRTTSVSGQTEDSLSKRLVFNMYNRVSRAFFLQDGTSSWTYNGGAYRAANGSSANRVEAIFGEASGYIRLHLQQITHSNITSEIAVGICQDCTSAVSSNSLLGEHTSGQTTISAHLELAPAIGYHYYQWVEYGEATGICTFYGATNAGLTGSVVN